MTRLRQLEASNDQQREESSMPKAHTAFPLHATPHLPAHTQAFQTTLCKLQSKNQDQIKISISTVRIAFISFFLNQSQL
jgi:hypothetical protein